MKNGREHRDVFNELVDKVSQLPLWKQIVLAGAIGVGFSSSLIVAAHAVGSALEDPPAVSTAQPRHSENCLGAPTYKPR